MQCPVSSIEGDVEDFARAAQQHKPKSPLSKNSEMFLLVCLAAFISPCSPTRFRDDGPVIGLMAQDVKYPKANKISYIAASYVKTLESAGARVIPVIFFLPGGSANLIDSGYATAATVFYHLAIEANKKGDYFPIWGTCLGFEQLAVLTAQKNILVRTNTSAVSLPLNFTDEANGSKMFRDFPPEMMHALATEPMTINAHKWSISMETYHENADLNRFYKVLSTNTDGMVEFISTFEAFDYPFYGVQWHPEKHPYEWTQDFYGHSPNSIRLTFYIAEFFVSEARKNKHKFESEKAIRDLLIYHFHPNYTGETASVFEQKYFFYDEQEEEEPPEEDIFRASGAGQTLAEVNMVLVTAVFLTGILSGQI